MEALGTLERGKTRDDGPLRFVVQDVYRRENKRWIAGRLESGTLERGEHVTFWPLQTGARVLAIQQWPQEVARAPQRCFDRGRIGRAHLRRPRCGRQPRDRRSGAWSRAADHGGLARRRSRACGRDAAHASGNARNSGDVAEDRRDDRSRLACSRRESQELRSGDVGVVSLVARELIAADTALAQSSIGRFVLLRSAAVVAGGRVDAVLGQARGEGATNVVAMTSSVDRAERVQRNGHTGGVFWLTGLPERRKIDGRMAVQRMLFERGRHVYVLDGDTLRTGLNVDLGFTDEDRSENVRRTAAVAGVFADAGFIVICALISPFSRRIANSRGRRIRKRSTKFTSSCDLANGRGSRRQGALRARAARRTRALHRRLVAVRSARAAGSRRRYRRATHRGVGIARFSSTSRRHVVCDDPDRRSSASSSGLCISYSGVGAGSLTTPLIVLFLGYNASTAIGSDLLFSLGTKIVAFLTHIRAQTVNYAALLFLSIGGVPGAILGVLITGWLHAHFPLPLVNHALKIALGVALLDRRGRGGVYALDPGRHQAVRLSTFRACPLVAIGFIVGTLVSITSIGSGSLTLPLLLLVLSQAQLRTLVGTDVAFAVVAARSGDRRPFQARRRKYAARDAVARGFDPRRHHWHAAGKKTSRACLPNRSGRHLGRGGDSLVPLGAARKPLIQACVVNRAVPSRPLPDLVVGACNIACLDKRHAGPERALEFAIARTESV